MIIEPVASARFARIVTPPEFNLILRLARSSPWTPEKWRDILTAAKLHVMHEEGADDRRIGDISVQEGGASGGDGLSGKQAGGFERAGCMCLGRASYRMGG